MVVEDSSDDTQLQHQHDNDQDLDENIKHNISVSIQIDSDIDEVQEQGNVPTEYPTNVIPDPIDDVLGDEFVPVELGIPDASTDEQNNDQQADFVAEEADAVPEEADAVTENAVAEIDVVQEQMDVFLEENDAVLDETGELQEESDAVTEETDAEDKKIRTVDDLLLTRDLPKMNRIVRYRVNDSDQWKKALIMSRGGRANGKYKFWLNVKHLEDDEEKCIDWKSVKEWQDIEENVLAASDKLYDYEIAQERELDNWKQLDVYQEVEDNGQDFVTVKWVPSLKEVGGNKVKKARLVARGYEEFIKTQTDSPTCTKESARVAIAIISSKQWDINSIDIKAAFLQGKELDREIFLKPPKEAQCPGKLWKLKRAVYGLNYASRFWYFQVKEELNRLGCKNSKFDSALFIYYTDSLEGLLIAHVDDFLWAGTERFAQLVMLNLKQTFRISTENAAMFTYIGIELQKTNEGVYMAQQKYLEDLKEIEISSSRRKEKESPITAEKCNR